MDRWLENIQQRGWTWPFGLISTALSVIFWWLIYANLHHVPAFVHAKVLLVVHPAFVITSIMAHEVGHFVALRRLGIRPLIFCMLIGGGTFIPNKTWQERQRSIALNDECQVILGGVMANAMLVVCGLLMMLWSPLRLDGQVLSYLNGFIILGNLVPLGKLDGGRFIHRALGRGYTGDYTQFNDRLWPAVYTLYVIAGAMAIRAGKFF